MPLILVLGVKKRGYEAVLDIPRRLVLGHSLLVVGGELLVGNTTYKTTYTTRRICDYGEEPKQIDSDGVIARVTKQSEGIATSLLLFATTAFFFCALYFDTILLGS